MDEDRFLFEDEPLVLKRRGFRIPWYDIAGVVLYGFVFGVPWAVGVAYIISELVR